MRAPPLKEQTLFYTYSHICLRLGKINILGRPGNGINTPHV
jgi:hypothetical protein